MLAHAAANILAAVAAAASRRRCRFSRLLAGARVGDAGLRVAPGWGGDLAFRRAGNELLCVFVCVFLCVVIPLFGTLQPTDWRP